MLQENGNHLLEQLESKFGRLALPQILRWIAGFQALSWGLSLFSPAFLEWIVYDREAIMSGQVWRLFTWVLFPVVGSGGSPITVLFVLIALLFMFFISDSLEGHWGSFRLNVYVLSTILILCTIGLIPLFGGAGLLFNGIFYSAVFLAFATLFPDHTIHLFMIIPIKAKWLGWVNVLMLGSVVIGSPLAMIVVFAGLLPYGLAFGPSFFSGARQRSEASVRRHKFEEASQSGNEPFHVCESCGATDISHPEREFRVNAKGQEICDHCRANSADSN